MVLKEIKIEFDYLHGPLWKDVVDVNTGETATGVGVIDDDYAIQVLNAKAQAMFASLYSFDTDGCVFDEEGFQDMKKPLLSMVQTIISRLAFLNDGSYEVVDKATEFLK